MNKNWSKLVWSILIGGAAVLVGLPACGGSAQEIAPSATAPQSTAVIPPTPTATALPTVTPPLVATATPLATTPSTGPANDASLAVGKEMFETKAGGVGCAFCHGLAAKGDGEAGLGAPDIRGASRSQIQGALTGGVPLMSFIKLSEQEIDAVAAYVQFLGQQP